VDGVAKKAFIRRFNLKCRENTFTGEHPHLDEIFTFYRSLYHILF